MDNETYVITTCNYHLTNGRRYPVSRVGVAPGGRQSKEMLNCNVRSRKVIENTRNNDVMSCQSTDNLGDLTPVLTESAVLGATKLPPRCELNPSGVGHQTSERSSAERDKG